MAYLSVIGYTFSFSQCTYFTNGILSMEMYPFLTQRCAFEPPVSFEENRTHSVVVEGKVLPSSGKRR